MTIETKHTLEVDDIKAFEIACVNCQTVVSIPIEQCTKTMPQCPRCSAALYSRGAAENDAIISLAHAIGEIKAEAKKAKFRFRIEFKADCVSHGPAV